MLETAIPGDQSQQLGRYRLLTKLGEGGMADVYLGASRGPNDFSKLLVLKLLKESLASDPAFVEMFMNEAKLAARLNHPNVVQTYEVGRQDGRHSIVMEYLEGQSLASIRQKAQGEGRRIPLDVHLSILCQGLAGLHHAHELADFSGKPLGLVHRDMTPNNLFVTYVGQAKVLDFGIAKAANLAPGTTTGIMKGTVRYMPPEAFLSEPIDRRSDLYSVGVMIWEAAAGRPLWHGISDAAVMHRVCGGEIPSVRSVAPGCPAELDEICLRAMSENPAARYATAKELRDDLLSFLGTLGGSSDTTDATAHLVADWFSEQRERMQTLIRSQLSLLHANDSGGHLVVNLATDDGPVTVATRPSRVERRPTRRWVWMAAITAAALGTAAWAFGRTAAEPKPTAEPESTSDELRVLAPDRQSPTSDELEDTASTGPGPESAGDLDDDAVAPAPGREANAPAEVAVRISASPSEAQLFLDGEPLEGNPAMVTHERDEETHLVRAEAPGHLPREVEVEMSRNVDVAITLSERPRRRARPTGPSRGSGSTSQPMMAPELDRSNPWAH